MRQRSALKRARWLFVVLTAGCGAGETAPHAHGHAPDAVAAIPGMSVYNLAGEWLDQFGRARPLDSLGGRVQLVALAYTNCAVACPQIVADMKRIEAQVPDVGFVLVSIDPARDTPDQLRRFAEGSRLPPARWTLLHGADDQLLELAAVLGIRYRRISDTDFMHSNVIVVIDERGEVLHRQAGLGAVEETVSRLREHLDRPSA